MDGGKFRIPIPGHPEIEVEYEELLGLLRAGEKLTIGKLGGEKFDPFELLEGYPSLRPSEKGLQVADVSGFGNHQEVNVNVNVGGDRNEGGRDPRTQMAEIAKSWEEQRLKAQKDEAEKASRKLADLNIEVDKLKANVSKLRGKKESLDLQIERRSRHVLWWFVVPLFLTIVGAFYFGLNQEIDLKSLSPIFAIGGLVVTLASLLGLIFFGTRFDPADLKARRARNLKKEIYKGFSEEELQKEEALLAAKEKERQKLSEKLSSRK